uniref:Uncharacterized protein n=1 Tax=Candidatus Kentrum sp. TUN TaxID=2126343 RepID=A0A451A327_9GAMM|nr:MAG: hypothetical protein BECKTUN1418D_GA0071000_112310 [Candidatus Kentron sp. TUN]
MLDERVNRERAECYEKHGAVTNHGSLEDWKSCHNVYLEKEISVRGDESEPPEYIEDVTDSEICPDTFRFPVVSSSLGCALHADLIRVQKVSSLVRKLGESVEDILALAEGTLANDHESSRDLDELLRRFARNRKWQPVFASPWKDLSDLFGETPEGDPSGLANNLRDRLGLYAYDPKQSDTVHILVFRYPIRAVPRLSGFDDQMRPLTVPCVLDGVLSPAFCPSFRESDVGFTVDLSGPHCHKLTREVLHPAMRLRANDLFRVCSITDPVDPSTIPEQRGLHLSCLREISGRPKYAEHTDEDLLQ